MAAPMIVNLFDTCGDETRFCLLIFRSDNPLLKTDYRKQSNTPSEKKQASRFFDFAGKMDIKAR